MIFFYNFVFSMCKNHLPFFYRYRSSNKQTAPGLWNDDEIDEFGRARSKPSPLLSQSVAAQTAEQKGKHELFYCSVQAACYILCFHGTDMAHSQCAQEADRIKWERVISCRFVPLRFCLSSVRQEFIRLAQHTGLLRDAVWQFVPDDVKNLAHESAGRSVGVPISVPIRNKITVMTGQALKGAKANPLESFFPFDPCLLRMLHQPIDNLYRYWQGLPGLDLATIDCTGQFNGSYADFPLDDDGMSDVDMYSTCSGSSMTSAAFGSHMSTSGDFLKSYIGAVDDSAESENSKVYEDDDGGINSLANNGWALPVRRPRQFSIGSTGSW